MQSIQQKIEFAINDANLDALKDTLRALNNSVNQALNLTILKPLINKEFHKGLKYILSDEFIESCPNLNIQVQSGYGFESLILALVNNYIYGATLLLNSNAPLSYFDQNDNNLYQLLISKAKDAQSLNWLLSEEFQQAFPNTQLPDINNTNSVGKTVLTYALAHGHHFVEALLTHGPRHQLNYRSQGTHSDNGTIVLKTGREAGFGTNALVRGKALFLMGAIAWHDNCTDDFKSFLKLHGCHVWQQDDYIILSGKYYLSHLAIDQYLTSTYGNLVTAYFEQAKIAKQRHLESQNAMELNLICHLANNATEIELTVPQKIYTYSMLAYSYYHSSYFSKAQGFILKLQSLLELAPDTELFDDQLLTTIAKSCSNGLMEKTVEELLAHNNFIKCQGNVLLDHNIITLQGRSNIQNLIVRPGDQNTPEIEFLTAHDIQISNRNNNLTITGALGQLPRMEIQNFMTNKYGSTSRYCINESINAINVYQETKEKSELDDAEFLLECCLGLPEQNPDKSVALLYLGNIQLLNGEPYIALAYYKRAMALLENKGIGFNEITHDLQHFQSIAIAVFKLQNEQNLSHNSVKTLCENYQYVSVVQSALQALQSSETNTAHNISKIFQSPQEALWFLQSLNITPSAKDNVAKDFAELRKISRVIMQGRRQDTSQFFQLPLEVCVNIISRLSNNALSKQAATTTVLQSLLESDDTRKRFAFKF